MLKEPITKYGNDLVRFEVKGTIPEGVSVFNWCSVTDLDKNATLFAIGFAQTQGDNDLPCDLFQQQLTPVGFDKCVGVRNDRNVTAIMPDTHICVEPGLAQPPQDPKSSCIQCLTASSSVLHVHRADGSQCVMGIATPTTNVCLENSKEMLYYTLIKKEYILKK